MSLPLLLLNGVHCGNPKNDGILLDTFCDDSFSATGNNQVVTKANESHANIHEAETVCFFVEEAWMAYNSSTSRGESSERWFTNLVEYIIMLCKVTEHTCYILPDNMH